MRSPAGIVIGFVVALLACSPPADDGDAGSDAGPPELDAGPACPAPDTVCPPYVPPPELACVGDLECTYPDYEARCEDGVWRLSQLCDRCFWPIVERCDDPFTGTLPGATISIGPPGEARPFEDGEALDVIWGPQGSPMIAFAVEVHADEPPACATVSGSFIGLGPAALGDRPVRLHCGRSRTIYGEIAYTRCDPGRPVSITLRVAGVDDEVTANLAIRGEDCP